MKIKSPYVLILIFAAMFCVIFFAGCQSEQIKEPQQGGLSERSDKLQNNNLPEMGESGETLAIKLLYTALMADFIVPHAPHWEIVHIIHDDARDRWAVVYAVSNHEDKSTPWSIWREATMHIQFFDGQGSFTNQINTEFRPVVDSYGNIISFGKIVFEENFLSFFSIFGVDWRTRFFICSLL